MFKVFARRVCSVCHQTALGLSNLSLMSFQECVFHVAQLMGEKFTYYYACVFRQQLRVWLCSHMMFSLKKSYQKLYEISLDL